MSTITRIARRDTTDVITGEIEEHVEVESFSVESEGSYFKMFTKDLATLHGTTHAAKKVLFELLIYETNRRGEIVLGLHQKKAMAQRIGFSHTKSIDNGVGSLINKGILLRIGRGTYKVNPNIFAKGMPKEIIEDRIKYAKLVIIYSDKGREVSSEIVMKENIK